MNERAHAPGVPEKIRYPGGKDGWFRVPCVACPYQATEAAMGRAIKRVQDHADAKNPTEEA